jgi:hypothetical protein
MSLDKFEIARKVYNEAHFNKIELSAKTSQKFLIPVPESGEAEDKYISRCMEAIGGEYDTNEQALAVCYAQLEK